MRPSPLIWLLIVSLILIPSAAGRFLLDLAGGIIIISLLLPLILSGIGWIGWRILRKKIIKCDSCGVISFNNSSNCTICGSDLTLQKDIDTSNDQNQPASSVTIDIIPENQDAK